MARFFVAIGMLALGVLLFQANPAEGQVKSGGKVTGKVLAYTAGTSINVEYKVEGVVKKAAFNITKFTKVQGTVAVGATVTIQAGDDARNARMITVVNVGG